MRHGRGVFDERLHSAQADCKLKQFGRLDKPLGRRKVAAELEGYHRPKAAVHLPPGKLVARMSCKSRVIHPRYLRMAGQPLGQRLRGTALLADSQLQRLEAASA